MINEFRGEYFFLSNFYEAPVEFDGLHYRNTEAAFQAQKTIDPTERKRFTRLNPSEAKRLGRHVKLRTDWETVKYTMMYNIVTAKFTQNEDLRARLLAAGNEELIEGNDWGDKTWGMVNGEGQNLLGKILMDVREELRKTEYQKGGNSWTKVKNEIVKWIRNYFKENGGPNTNAVIGISGGKDSSIVAALCVEALGKDRVLGVMMPQGEQVDIDCSKKLIKHLGIDSMTINVGNTVNTLQDEIGKVATLTPQATINTPARIRMATLYAVAACVDGRVANTCNLSEDYVGYSTKFGDAAGDFSPLSDFTVTEVLEIGKTLNLPTDLLFKVPIDGLCGKTDEENLGFSYAQLDKYIRGIDTLEDKPELKEKIDTMHRNSRHKLLPMPKFEYNT